MDDVSPEANNFYWLLDNFVHDTAGVTDAVAVSSDGLTLGASGLNGVANAEQLGALIAGVSSLAGGVADFLQFREKQRVIIEMSLGYFIVSSISSTSSIGVVAERDADLGLIAYEIAMLVRQVGRVLTPEVIAELQNLLVL